MALQPVDITSLERTTLENWRQFLAGYFDGNAHTVADTPIDGLTFPLVELAFQKAALAQPSTGPSISLLWTVPSLPTRRFEQVNGERGIRYTLACTWMFLIRAKTVSNPAAGNAKAQIMAASDLLFLLLSTPAAMLPLAKNGIRHVRPNSPQLVVMTADDLYEVRSITCRGMLRYPSDDLPTP